MKEVLEKYVCYLMEEEKALSTVEKYRKAVLDFLSFTGGELRKQQVIGYKQHLLEVYRLATVNTILAALNSFFCFIGRSDLRVKRVKVQKQMFRDEKKELTKKEYLRLIETARLQGDERLMLIMQTLCATGIRISELKWVTRESLNSRQARVFNKGKYRTVILSAELCKKLKKYCRHRKISSGPVFVTRGGKPVNRSNIWCSMKKLCEAAEVEAEKVFPHNLRHLFARTFYELKKDLTRLADILGHSSIETTRIYTMTKLESVEGEINRLRLVV